MWNVKNLPEPPRNTYKATKGDIDLLKFRHSLHECIAHFKDNKFLIGEAALLSRILYRMKTKFRNSKHMKLISKISHCLNIYFSINMERHIQNVLNMMPCTYGKDTYLPTKNMLAYVLVRLQGLAKLMERTYDSCVTAAAELEKILNIGHFWKMFIIVFAMVSRISLLVKFNTKYVCEIYGKLLPYVFKLENNGRDWLPRGYVFPPDLREWLCVSWVRDLENNVYEKEFVDLTIEPVNEVVDFFNLVDDDEEEVIISGEYILLDDEDKQIQKDFNQLPPINKTYINKIRGFHTNVEEDVGEEITDLHPKNKSDDVPEDVGEEITESKPKKRKSVDSSVIDITDESIIESVQSSIINLLDETDSVIDISTPSFSIKPQKKVGHKTSSKKKKRANKKNIHNPALELESSKPRKRKLNFKDTTPKKKMKKTINTNKKMNKSNLITPTKKKKTKANKKRISTIVL